VIASTHRDAALGLMTAYCEASSASPDERRFVIRTFFNRLALGKPARYGSTVAGVCVKRYQYSEWNADVADNANLERGAEAPEDDPVLQDCAAAYDEVAGDVAAGAPDPTGGATHYFDHSIKPPYWAAQATITLTTDNFTFLKDVP